MSIKQRIINKMNEGQEPDVKKYNWNTISDKMKLFWFDYFENKDKRNRKNVSKLIV